MKTLAIISILPLAGLLVVPQKLLADTTNIAIAPPPVTAATSSWLSQAALRRAQVADKFRVHVPTNASSGTSTGNVKPTVIETGPHHRTWTFGATNQTSTAPSPGSSHANGGAGRVVEVATGLNYWDGRQYSPSDPSFAVTVNGFSATHVQAPVQLTADLNTAGAVTVTTPDGITLQSTPIAVALYNSANDQLAVIATLTNSIGILISSNQVEYDNPFSGICSKVVYTLEKGAFQQDLVLTANLDPSAWGFPPATTRIQIITRFYGVPTPDVTTVPLYVEQDQSVRSQMASPDFIDHRLKFGKVTFGRGRAYSLGADLTQRRGGAPVAKQFTNTLDGNGLLIESVNYSAIQNNLMALPPCAVQALPTGARVFTNANANAGYAALRAPSPALKTASNRSVTGIDQHAQKPRVVPPAMAQIKNSHSAKAAGNSSAPPRSPLLVKTGVPKQAGVVIDYFEELSGGLDFSVFAGDTTYFLSDGVIADTAVEIDGGAIPKYAPGAYLEIDEQNGLTFATSEYSQAIFTAADDDSRSQC